MGGNGYSGAESLESHRPETIVRASQWKEIRNVLGMLYERTEMRIALIDVDGYNFPKLPLMKLSAHHKQLVKGSKIIHGR